MDAILGAGKQRRLLQKALEGLKNYIRAENSNFCHSAMNPHMAFRQYLLWQTKLVPTTRHCHHNNGIISTTNIRPTFFKGLHS